MEEQSVIARESGLHKDLTRGQIIMISLGGAIGTSLFLSSGIALGYAGPSVLVSYAIAAFFAVSLVLSLSEMAVMHPTAGSFGTYAETYLNPLARVRGALHLLVRPGGGHGFRGRGGGHLHDLVVSRHAGLAVVAGVRVHRALCELALGGKFRPVEYWLAFIKVTAIVLFVILGATRIFGLGAPAVGFPNLYALPGGFFPHGFHGMWMAVILAMLSFVGVEVIAVTAAEVPHPEKAIPAALRTMTLRLFLFYVLALGVVAAIIPWTETGGSVTVAESPFVKILSLTGIPHAPGIMNFVIVSAALSGMNTNVYLCARMLFSLSRGKYAPAFLGRLSRAGAPVMATLFSGLCIFLAVLLAKFTPKAYAYLQGIGLFSITIVWMLILVSHLRFRQMHKASDLPVRMPFFPVMQIAGLAILAALLLTMAFDPDWRLSWIVGVPWLGMLTLAYFVWGRLAANGN